VGADDKIEALVTDLDESRETPKPAAADAGNGKRRRGSGATRGKKTGRAPKRRKTGSSVAKRQSRSPGEEKAAEAEQGPISRKELLERALTIIANDLNADERPSNTIASLVQLLKLDRSFTEEEEQPHEIRVVWQGSDDETDESAGSGNVE
jgi:hypothetical protein